MHQIFAALSVVAFLFAAPPYIINTLKGKTKPERMTWFIFVVLSGIAFISQLLIAANWSLVFLGIDFLANIIVFLLSLVHGVGGWTRLDKYALSVAGIGVAVSLAAKEPVVALLGAMLADIAGVGLTLWKVIQKPDSETMFSWLAFGTGGIFGVLSIGGHNWQSYLWPVYLVIACFSVPTAQIIGRHMKSA